MKYTPTALAANGDALICDVVKAANVNNWVGTVFFTGTFGGGTVTLQASFDGGTTKVIVKDVNGANVSTTTAASFTVPLGNGTTNSDNLKLYASLTGATSPALAINLFDNR